MLDPEAINKAFFNYKSNICWLTVENLKNAEAGGKKKFVLSSFKGNQLLLQYNSSWSFQDN